MSSYNLIPVTDLTAVGFTGTVSTTAFTVNSATVTEAVFSDKFVTNVFPTTQPMFTFAGGLGTGVFARQALGQAATLTIGLAQGGTTVAQFLGRDSGSSGNNYNMWLGYNSATVTQTMGIGGGSGFLGLLNVGNLAGGFAIVNTGVKVTAVGTHTGLSVINLGVGFNLSNGATTVMLTRVSTSTTNPTALGSIWIASEGDPTNFWHFNKPGLLMQATTSITPSLARSNAHINNLLTGIATLFVTLPTSSPGLKYTVSNARAVANTVVINPRAADTLQVFGLTKAAGASVAANAPFSSITFHCVTATRWVATKQTGAWV